MVPSETPRSEEPHLPWLGERRNLPCQIPGAIPPPLREPSSASAPAHSIPELSRRSAARWVLLLVIATWLMPSSAETPDLEERIRGLLLGSALGDALGGPIEFQDPAAIQRLTNPPCRWTDAMVLDEPERKATAARLCLRRYQDLRPFPESYGQWNTNAAPGTVTDDTRHKLILLHALHRAQSTKTWPLDRNAYAQSHLDWPLQPVITNSPAYLDLARDWLEEWQFAARWILGRREPQWAKPPERMWQGLPTCSGQMSLLPLAAIYAGDPDRAYRAAYHLGFFDNGFGKDLNAALVAGLATALAVPVDPNIPAVAWKTVLDSMRQTDPYAYTKIRWSERAVHRWLNRALQMAEKAEHRPARLFAALEAEFRTTTKWEAQVPFVVVFSCLALADFDPLAALQLTLEWGHDSDSYAQVAACFIGALYGTRLFPAEWLRAVNQRVDQDFSVNLDEEARFLAVLHREATQGRELVGERP